MMTFKRVCPPWQLWLNRLIALGVGILLMWLVIGLYSEGRAAWAVAILALGSLSIYIYSSAKTLAWRYLFPGVAGMIVFVAFPLLYTVQIGFTNYSASNLLSEERARAYLLDQSTVDENSAYFFTLHREKTTLRILLTPPTDSHETTRFISSAIKLDRDHASDAPIEMQTLTTTINSLGAPMSLREVLVYRDVLMAVRLKLPDNRTLQYVGVREFGSIVPSWNATADGALVQQSTGEIYVPNAVTGFFETAQGARMQPGFKVGIGFANYTRMMFDADIRGPFLSIFVWTIVFAGLTVLFSTILGMSLAMVLNWEALRYRTVYRTLLFLPYAVPGFISILIFKGLFNQNFGEINAILNALFGIRPAWFADPLLAKTMLLIVNTWLGYPYIMVLCTGLIKSIPADLYEASAIAGAKPLTNAVRITIPLLIKPLTPLLIAAFAFNFNNFVLISLLTDGRPDYLNTKLPAGTTDILVSYTYRIAFTDAGTNFGLAAAISTLIFFMVALLSLANLKLARVNEKKG